MKPLVWLGAVLVLVVVTACTGAGAPSPSRTVTPALTPTFVPSPTSTPASTRAPALAYSGFSIGVDTGSVPPPFNYTYTIDGTFQPAALSVHYVLTYHFRDQIPTAEITSQGYTLHDDIDWSALLTGQTLETWRALLAGTTLGPIPPLAPGAGSFSVTLTPIAGEPQVGVPTNRDAWQTAIAALDKQARAETGATRSEP